jgi:predicted CoA-substrate-specific enzyme activase
VVATGYGRVSIDFASKRFTEIACHARGAHHHNPCVRTVVDIGGQDSKVIKLNEGGDVIDFCMNDKCAAGTGKFLEIMAKTLTVDLVELGPVAAASRAPCALSSTCSVFAESEVVSLLAEGASREDILAGVCRSVARRVGNMAVRMGLDGDVVFVGGVSKNVGVRRELQEFLGIEFFELPGDPQLNGALGAALLAKEADHGNQ